MSCPICRQRASRRFCPALHDRICAVCCGTEREVTLDCPADCPYLRQARRHEKPRPLSEQEVSGLYPQVQIPQPFLARREPLLVGLSFGLARAARCDRELRDSDLVAALQALAGAQQVLANSGLVVEEKAVNPAQQRVTAELNKMAAEYRELEQRYFGYADLKHSELLQAYVFLLRLAVSRGSGRPRSRAFVEFLLQQFPEKPAAGQAPGSSSLIIPGA